MFKRHSLLLFLLSYLEENDRLNNLFIMKMMFLYAKEQRYDFSMYSFHPYKYGPYSSKIYNDLDYFTKIGYVEKIKVKDKRETFKITEKGKEFSRVRGIDIEFFRDLINNYADVNDLVSYVYKKYPSYTILSEWKMQDKPSIPKDNTPKFFLIGYEGRDIDNLMNELIQNNIKTLVDIRFNARSMKYDFNKGRLSKFLANVKIDYKHIPELGIDESLRKNLNSQEDYEFLFLQYRSDLKNRKEYLDKLINDHSNERVALLCFEKNLKSCHRREIGTFLKERGFSVESIS